MQADCAPAQAEGQQNSFHFFENLGKSDPLNVLFITADADVLMQVVKASDVLFLFGSLADIRDTIKSIKGDLKGNQIVVPVTKEGDLDVFQVKKVHFLPGFDSACFLSNTVAPDRETLHSFSLAARAVLHTCQHVQICLV